MGGARIRVVRKKVSSMVLYCMATSIVLGPARLNQVIMTIIYVLMNELNSGCPAGWKQYTSVYYIATKFVNRCSCSIGPKSSLRWLASYLNL